MVRFIIKGECTSSTEASNALSQIRQLMDPIYKMEQCTVTKGYMALPPIGVKSENKSPYTFRIIYNGDFERKHELLFRDLDTEVQGPLSKILCWGTYDFELKELK